MKVGSEEYNTADFLKPFIMWDLFIYGPVDSRWHTIYEVFLLVFGIFTRDLNLSPSDRPT